jgi:integrase
MNPLVAVSLPKLPLPSVGQVEHADGGCPGLRFRLSQGGKRTWVLGCRDALGKPRRFVLGDFPAMGLAEARERARALRQDVRRGRDPIKEKRDAVVTAAAEAEAKAKDAKAEVATLRSLLDGYAAAVGASRRSWAEARRRIESVFAAHLDMRSASLTPAGLQLTVDAHPSRSSAGAAVRYLRPVLKWGAKRGLAERGMGEALDMPEGALGVRTRVLSRPEIAAILGALNKAGAYGRALRWLFWTGCRLNEACGARWRDVGMDAATWTIPQTKQGKPLVVPLPPAALAMVRAMLPKDAAGQPVITDPEALVFAGATGGPLVNWDRATKALQAASGTAGWHRHDIRRTVATLLGRLGVAPHVIEVALGHAIRTSSDGSALGRVATVYNRSRYEHEHRVALDLLAAELASIEPKIAITVTAIGDVVRPGDVFRLRAGLDAVAWGNRPDAATLDALANALVVPVEQARTKLPRMNLKAKPASGTSACATAAAQPVAGKPCGGRKRNEQKAVLGASVAAAMERLGVGTGRWHQNGPDEGSPYLQVLGLCWSIASGKPRGADDARRLVADGRRWVCDA